MRVQDGPPGSHSLQYSRVRGELADAAAGSAPVRHRPEEPVRERLPIRFPCRGLVGPQLGLCTVNA